MKIIKMYLVHTVKIEKTLQLFKSAQFLNVDELTLMSDNWKHLKTAVHLQRKNNIATTNMIMTFRWSE